MWHKRTRVCQGYHYVKRYEYYLYLTEIVRVKMCSLQILQITNHC